ncbi:outer membrane protein assembly factor BamD [Pseudomonadota bacterium]
MLSTSTSLKFPNTSKLLIAILIAAMMIMVSGCKKDKNIDDGRSASEMYDTAKKYLVQQNWGRAIQAYQGLSTRFPFGRYTEQAQLELAYAYHKGGNPEAALSTADRFIRTYPSHPNVDYAYYIRGLTNYEQRVGFMERMMPSRVRDRDQTAARESFRDFDELIRRFPDSRYGPDARQRMVFLRNNLSFYELDVARYYLRRKAYVASANRARYAIENYPGSPELGNALEILHVSYTEMGLPELAADTMKILALNYPDHPYVTGESGQRFWNKLWPFGKDN